MPYDLWNSFEHASGKKLDWFLAHLVLRDVAMDLAITGGRVVGDSLEIDIERRQPAPMPAILLVRGRADAGSRRRAGRGVAVSATRHTVRVPASPRG